MREMMHSFDEIALQATPLSTVHSRKEVDPFEGDTPRIWISPMTCIVNKKNYDRLRLSRIFTPIAPVTFSNMDWRKQKMCEGGWIAMSCNEFEEFIRNCNLDPSVDGKYRICIDTAQGHMDRIYNLVREGKEAIDGLEVMIGNITNPQTYIECCRAGVDWVRLSVGTGSACITSVRTGYHVSMPWLLEQIAYIRSNIIVQQSGPSDPPTYIYNAGTNDEYMSPEDMEEYGYEETCELVPLATRTKIIADGGIKDTATMLKAFALGADSVMCGGLLAGVCVVGDGYRVGENRSYYGQASELGQIDRFGEVRNVPEGIARTVPIKHTLEELEDEIEGVFKSALSYNDSRDLDDFIGHVDYNYQSIAEFNAYNK